MATNKWTLAIMSRLYGTNAGRGLIRADDPDSVWRMKRARQYLCLLLDQRPYDRNIAEVREALAAFDNALRENNIRLGCCAPLNP